MQLVSLSIERANQLLREITFKNGLNLILDKPTVPGQQSGNNVGKTTALRLIDFCLGFFMAKQSPREGRFYRKTLLPNATTGGEEVNFY
jgi:uncharacterized protein YydD (DUF2326 family)